MTTSELQQVFGQDAAKWSKGRSAESVLGMVARFVSASGLRPGRLLDVGAGSGGLYSALPGQFETARADLTISVETIETSRTAGPSSARWFAWLHQRHC